MQSLLKKQLYIFITLIFCSTWSNANTQVPDSVGCQVSYPIVLSHHWGIRKICANAPDESCDRLEPARYCAEWQWDEAGLDQDCVRWQIPEDEQMLPPRDSNEFEPALSRDLSEYHRYFSRAIVDRIGSTCANQVYLSDKPAFSSSLERARSLRNTVLKALRETGQDKVIILGMSQGSQDARMLAMLPLSENVSDGQQGMMDEKIAAIVSIVGENQGSWSASSFLNTMYAQNLLAPWHWSDYRYSLIWQLGKDLVYPGLWRDESDQFILSENDPQGLTEEDVYRHYLASTVTLSKKYMTDVPFDWVTWEDSWDELQRFLRLDDKIWTDMVPPAVEASNDITYFSYAAQVRRWNKDWGQSGVIPFYIKVFEGPHDGYATVASQKFGPNMGANFSHVKTYAGKWGGSGYHHMFFSGRNDSLYSPESRKQEVAPYSGSSADFYQRVLEDLVKAGF